MKRIVITLCFILNALISFTAEISGSLPVLHVNTSTPITSKEEYVTGTLIIDSMNGTAPSKPIAISIRGRGNWTWSDTFDKKSYKIKFKEETAFLGMPADKHFALLAHADGYQNFFSNKAGFFLSEQFQMPFTPKERAVEVVLNGDYIGLYIVTETVRISPNRVNITEQNIYTTDPQDYGGWLLELDNNEDTHQAKIPVSGTNLERFWVTIHSPEELSVAQFNGLYVEMEELLKKVFCEDKDSREWEEMIDLNMLARYYLINEMIDHVEAFQGSCYFFRDKHNKKWMFGPLWDLGHALNNWHSKDRYIYDVDGWTTDISREFMKFPRFRNTVGQLWKTKGEELMESLKDEIRQFADSIQPAFNSNCQRWPKYYPYTIDEIMPIMLAQIDAKKVFLNSVFTDTPTTIESTKSDTDNTNVTVYNLQGKKFDGNHQWHHQIVIKKGKKFIGR